MSLSAIARPELSLGSDVAAPLLLDESLQQRQPSVVAVVTLDSRAAQHAAINSDCDVVVSARVRASAVVLNGDNEHQNVP